MTANYKQKEVKFDAKISDSTLCVCDACHATEKVVKLSLPYTKFYNGELETRPRAYWLCHSCYHKLEQAMLYCENEEDNT